MMSSPFREDKTNAGRRFASDKSENGKGITTISPFINFIFYHVI